jgi:4-alpha-glucanotransferase
LKSMPTSPATQLRHLARLFNVQTDYYDIFGHRRQSSPQAILRVLQALGAQVERIEDLSDALRARQHSLCKSPVDPVIVAWGKEPINLSLRLPVSQAEKPLPFQIQLEDGECLNGAIPFDLYRNVTTEEAEGVSYVSLQPTLRVKLPYGYHRLRLETDHLSSESLLISAPLFAHTPIGEQLKTWGMFAPLYALQSQKNWGAGDLSDLGEFIDWAKSLGGRVVGTLPLLAAFLDEPYDPSPYSPVSRFFWNEFYLDLSRLPELQHSSGAKAIINSADFKTDVETLRSAPLVDYRRQMALKRKVLEELARSLFTEKSKRYTALRQFIESYPQVEDYAQFRATMEKQRKPWLDWPQRSRDGTLSPNEYAEETKRYHLYSQWAIHEQIKLLGDRTKKQGVALYLDFPLGVHRDGYDTWRERSSFALEMSGGAPPDGFFIKGQNWGFPPLHPDRLRENGYRYFIASIRHHLKHAGMVRIDHVMGLHRLYWIPKGFEPTEGVYVHYRPREFYAILTLESHRHEAAIVGENLGTVPPSVNTAMSRHRIRGMYLGQFAVRPDSKEALEKIPPATVASLNTHDTPTFAAFWNGLDIEDRLKLGLLDETAAFNEGKNRMLLREALTVFLQNGGYLKKEPSDTAAVLKAWLMHMSSKPAEVILVNLEDLWLETRPQNIPGTCQEYPNWRHKMRYSFELLSRSEDILDTLKAVDACRKREG